MKKILLNLAIVMIGITIMYNAETGEGWVQYNRSPDNAAFITLPSLNSVEALTVTRKFTMDKFLEMFGNITDKEFEEATKSIIILKPLKGGGVKY